MFVSSQATRSAPVEGSTKDDNAFPVHLLRPPRCSSSICSQSKDKNIPPYIYAIDHLSTKLRIPISATEPTQAFKDDGLVPGLCRLYMEGRCRQGDFCHQVHGDLKVVETLRQEALHAPSCCHIHGAKCNFESFPLGLTCTLVDNVSTIPPNSNSSISRCKKDETADVGRNDVNRASLNVCSCPGPGKKPLRQTSKEPIMSIHSLCPTSYLWSLYSQDPSSHIHLPKNKICREHRKGLCRFGDQCNFLHVCREIPIDLSSSFDGMQASHSGNHSLVFAPSERFDGRFCNGHQSSYVDMSHKWKNPHPSEFADGLYPDNSLDESLGSFSECIDGYRTAPGHACTYSGMRPFRRSKERVAPLLRPYGSKKMTVSGNNQKNIFSQTPYLCFR